VLTHLYGWEVRESGCLRATHDVSRRACRPADLQAERRTALRRLWGQLSRPSSPMLECWRRRLPHDRSRFVLRTKLQHGQRVQRLWNGLLSSVDVRQLRQPMQVAGRLRPLRPMSTCCARGSEPLARIIHWL